MFRDKKVTAIIAAAGFGKRMNSAEPKQFLKIGGKPILAVAAETFDKNPYVDEIIISTGADYREFVRLEIAERFGLHKITKIVSGGVERQDSVWNALKALSADTDIVLIHDGARPYVSGEVIERVLQSVVEKRAVAAAVPSKDTVKFLDGEVFTETPDRSRVYNIQTPQGFERALLIRAYEQAFADGFYGTDDAVLVERIGESVYFSMGDYKNIKITTPEDMPPASEEYACEENFPRIGMGYDVHRLAEGRNLVLGGVTIPFERGLLGHSDADVLLHALMDALLGAAALGDIGRHFPDTEQRFKDISSMKLLLETEVILRNAGYRVANVDVTVIAERPKLARYMDLMKNNIAGALRIDFSHVNIKATTTEKLGFCGREEGIAAEAAVILRPIQRNPLRI